MKGERLTGNYWVRPLRPALDESCKLCPRKRDRMELRAHALKLRYWPATMPSDDNGQLLDLDWSWIRAAPRLQIGELRIGDVIGGNDNLRLIFFVGERLVALPMPVIWILRVMQKKRDDFSTNDLAIAKARRLIVLERFYTDHDK
jgi:hypothetical protein